MNLGKLNKTVILIDTDIDFSINFVNIAYMIAQSLGLDREEW